MHIHHIAIWCRNLEAQRAFYEKYFTHPAGPKYTNPRTGFQSYFLSLDDGAKIELMQMQGIPDNANDPVAQAIGITHLSISVGSERAVDALTGRLEADGCRVVGRPRRTGDGYYESVVLDPEGNRVEIVG